jgi:TNF receptor-associated protein 1
LGISVQVDEKENTFTITDTGVGMTHDELVDSLGSIAYSGSKSFLKQLEDGKRPDVNLIGQFGVGFYSAFMVASRVTVYSRSSQPDSTGWKWTSEGAGGYEIEPAEGLGRGTKIVLQLTEAAKEYSRRLHSRADHPPLLQFCPVPHRTQRQGGQHCQGDLGSQQSGHQGRGIQRVYHYTAHDTEDPIFRLHFSADAPIAIQALLFIPAQNMEASGFGRTEPEVHLYCRSC